MTEELQPPVRRRRGGAPPWIVQCVAEYWDAVFAWEANLGSGRPAPSSVPGTAGASIAMHQLEDRDIAEHLPRPLYKDFLRDHAARRRNPAA